MSAPYALSFCNTCFNNRPNLNRAESHFSRMTSSHQRRGHESTMFRMRAFLEQTQVIQEVHDLVPIQIHVVYQNRFAVRAPYLNCALMLPQVEGCVACASAFKPRMW